MTNLTKNEIFASYQQLGGTKSIKSFSNKSQLLAAIEDQQMANEYGITNCPHCDVHLSNGVMDGDETKFECMACGGGFGETETEEQRDETGRLAADRERTDKVIAQLRSGEHTIKGLMAALGTNYKNVTGDLFDIRNERGHFLAENERLVSERQGRVNVYWIA